MSGHESEATRYSGFAHRLQRLMEAPDAPISTVTALSRAIPVSYEMARRYTLGTAKPRDDKLETLAILFGVSAAYLDHGTEELTPDTVEPIRDWTQFVVLDHEGGAPNADDYFWVPQYDVRAACGSGYRNDDEPVKTGLVFRRDWLKRQGLTLNEDSVGVIYASDLSMWPTIEPDSVLLVDLTDNDPERLKNGKVYVFLHGYELRVKRVFIPVSGRQVHLVSDNPDKSMYPDELISHEQAFNVRFVGRVVWRAGEM